MPHGNSSFRRPSRYVLRLFERLTEMSYGKLFSLWALIVTGLALAYFILSTVTPEHGISGLSAMSLVDRLGNSLYFSIMTVTTVGYGDHAPLGASKFLAGIQAVFGFFVFAIFMGKLTSYKSEIILHETHTLMFENKFHLTREGFFMIRKDFDAIIRDAQERTALDEDDWDKLAIAYWEGQRLLESIPLFYGNGHDQSTHAIDEKRERLLIETVHRTCERLVRMLEVLEKQGIDWRNHERNHAELAEFADAAQSATAQWNHLADERNSEWFERLVHVIGTLQRQMII